MSRQMLINLASVLKYEAEHAQNNELNDVKFSIGTVMAMSEKLSEIAAQWKRSECEPAAGRTKRQKGRTPKPDVENGAVWVAVAARLFDVGHLEIVGSVRATPISNVRRVIVYCMRRAGMNYQQIARVIKKTPTACTLLDKTMRLAMQAGEQAVFGNTTMSVVNAVQAYRQQLNRAGVKV